MTVYFITRNDDPSRLVKIGYTADVDKRIRALMTSAPAGMTVVAEVDGGHKLERHIHKLLAKYKVTREWFMPECLSETNILERIASGEFSDIAAVSTEPRRLIEDDDEFSDDIVRETRFYLNELVKREWSGLGDTIEGARDRVADMLELPRTYLDRLWLKPQELRDVSGQAYRELRLRYSRVIISEGKATDRHIRFVDIVAGPDSITARKSAA